MEHRYASGSRAGTMSGSPCHTTAKFPRLRPRIPSAMAVAAKIAWPGLAMRVFSRRSRSVEKAAERVPIEAGAGVVDGGLLAAGIGRRRGARGQAHADVLPHQRLRISRITAGVDVDDLPLSAAIHDHVAVVPGNVARILIADEGIHRTALKHPLP